MKKHRIHLTKPCMKDNTLQTKEEHTHQKRHPIGAKELNPVWKTVCIYMFWMFHPKQPMLPV